MSIDSASMTGLTASKKYRWSAPTKRATSAARDSEVERAGRHDRELRVGDAAPPPPGGCGSRAGRVTASVTLAANSPRSTASALPAGTRTPSATRRISESMRRISSFSRPAAWSSASPRRLLEQTSSAKSAVWCTGVLFTGRISKRSTADAAPGELPRGLAAGETSAHDRYPRCHRLSV